MNTNTIQTEFTPDDPILTAYALGEIENPEQVKAIEKALAEDPALRETVEQAQEIDNQLADIFAAEEKPEVPAYLESSLEAWPKKKPSSGKARKWQWFYWTAPTLAAACLIAMLGLPVITGSLDQAEPVDRNAEGQVAKIASGPERLGLDSGKSEEKNDLSRPNTPVPLARPMDDMLATTKPAESPAPAMFKRKEGQMETELAESMAYAVAGNVRALGGANEKPALASAGKPLDGKKLRTERPS